MASSSGASGVRKGAGRKRNFDVSQEKRTVVIRLDSSIYERWIEFKNRTGLKTNSAVAEYLLNLAESFDEEPSG